jgi:hypothetical protein
MEFLNWLQALGQDADPSAPGFQAGHMYVFVCVALPVVFGLSVGFGLRLIERIFGVELGRGGGH